MTSDGEAEVVNRLPTGWRELFVQLGDPSDGVLKAEVWYEQVYCSQFGPSLMWSDLIHSLKAVEPVVTHDENLTFQPRLTVLSFTTQRNFLTFLHHHVDVIPADLLRELLHTHSHYSEGNQNSWLSFLSQNLRTKLRLSHSQSLRTCGGKSSAGSVDIRSQTFRYSFSTKENQNVFQGLCKEIRNCSEPSAWQRNYDFLKTAQGQENPGMEASVGSPVLVTSPDVVQSSDADGEDSPPIIPSSQRPRPGNRSTMSKPDGPAVKRLKLEASQSCSFLNASQSGDLSSSQISAPLTAEDWVMVSRLKDIWRTSSVDTPVPEEIRLFLSCTVSQMKDVCDELQLDTLSEVAMTVACDHVCSLGDELSHGNCVQFLTATVVPKVRSVTQTFPRSLCTVLVKLCQQFPRQLIDGVITACLEDDDAAVCQSQMFCKLTKETFTSPSRVYLLQKLVDESLPMSAGLMSLIQTLLELKVDMETAVINSLVLTLGNGSTMFSEDIKFGKLLLAFVTKYGKQIEGTNIERLKVICAENRTFLKKAILSGIAKLQRST